MNVLKIFLLFCYFGCLCFSGGNALVPLYIDDLVEARHWMTLHEFGNLMAIAQMTPGPIGVNAATFFGFRQAGIPGAKWVDLGKVNGPIEGLKKDEKLLLVCARGKRGYFLQNRLKYYGYTNTRVLEGGLTFNRVKAEKAEGALSAEEIKRVKGLGCLQDKRYPDRFNVRIITRNGKVTSENARAVAELVAMGRYPYLGMGGRLNGEDRKIVLRAVRDAEMEGHLEDAVCALSGGERQMAYFAMALAQDTKLVLLDEPTSNLDPEYRRRVFALMKRLCGEGYTFLVTLHDLEEAAEFADRIAVLDGGKTVFFGTAEEFARSGVAEKVFGTVPVRAVTLRGETITVFRPN